MTTIPVRIHKHSRRDDVVLIPDSVLPESKRPVQLSMKIGLMTKKIKCFPAHHPSKIYMSSRLIRYFGLREGFRCHLLLKGAKVTLGPVVGVYVTPGFMRRLNNQSYAFRKARRLFKANDVAQTILYYFAVHSVQAQRQKVRGMYYNPHTQKIATHDFPFPDVLYHRGGGKLSQAFHSLAQQAPVNYVNTKHHFNKWTLYSKLRRQPKLKKYLPNTFLYAGDADLNKAAKFPKAYIKTCTGSNGRHVLRAERCTPHRWKYVYVQGGRHIVGGEVSWSKLKKIIASKYKKGHSIIQASIDVLTKNRRNIDLRATMQRNKSGQVQIVGVTVRVARKGSPVTSTSTGSSCYSFESFFRKHWQLPEAELSELQNRIEQFLMNIYAGTEKAFGSFGELGIDFAIDRNMNIWFIECNAKPAKSALVMAHDRQTVLQAFTNPLEYARFLKGYAVLNER